MMLNLHHRPTPTATTTQYETVIALIYPSDIKSAIKQALTSVGLGMLCNQAKDFSGDEFTHKLIHMRINLEETEVEGEKADPYACCSCFLGSDYIAYKCLKRLKENKEDLRTFIETAMGSLCGQLFELVSHEILGTFPVRVNSQGRPFGGLILEI
ncbi:hypothetical protein RhiirC2_718351 [Rhizophagus irregularis]|uniref:Uncharacterized protein n=1 Tax=Rhizophagus irregularis TaxID=588596 RepID=A0A2N1MIR7_9GLOM|nr:hypothetical protein RhiirC2_718351 [Rhizophagus irregularis]